MKYVSLTNSFYYIPFNIHHFKRSQILDKIDVASSTAHEWHVWDSGFNSQYYMFPEYHQISIPIYTDGIMIITNVISIKKSTHRVDPILYLLNSCFPFCVILPGHINLMADNSGAFSESEIDSTPFSDRSWWSSCLTSWISKDLFPTSEPPAILQCLNNFHWVNTGREGTEHFLV